MLSTACASRPGNKGATWSDRYDATASSRPFSVPSPQPTSPSVVVILRVTKLRPGLATITSARSIASRLTVPSATRNSRSG